MEERTELISRQAALAEIDKNREALLQSGMKGAEHILVHYGRRVIEELPLVDVPDRKVGKWIKMSDADGVYWACSECGEGLPRINKFDPQFDLFPRLDSIDRTNYCPNCGAKMERSEE